MTRPPMLREPELPSTDEEAVAKRSERLRRLGKHPLVVGSIIAIIIMFVAPNTLNAANLSLVTTAAIFGLFALSGLVLFGWLGQGSFGQAAFFGTGAYTVALLKDSHPSPLVAILLGGLISFGFAFVIGMMTMNATGRQFAMLTLVLGEVMYQLTFTFRGTLGGDDGIFGVYPGTLFGADLTLPVEFWWYVTIVVGALALILFGIHRSQLGKSFRAVRDDPLKAAALGTSVRVVRTAAFLIAGFVGGVAGGLYAQQQYGVSPELLSTTISGGVIFMVLIGGTSSMWGPIIGALVYTVLTTKLFSSSSTATLWVGLLLLVVVLGVRGGIVGLVRRGIQKLKGTGNKETSNERSAT